MLQHASLNLVLLQRYHDFLWGQCDLQANNTHLIAPGTRQSGRTPPLIYSPRHGPYVPLFGIEGMIYQRTPTPAKQGKGEQPQINNHTNSRAQGTTRLPCLMLKTEKQKKKIHAAHTPKNTRKKNYSETTTLPSPSPSPWQHSTCCPCPPCLLLPTRER